MYQLYFADNVLRISDGIVIPPDPANRDYSEYLEWVAAGNEPLPAPPPVIGNIQDLAEAKKVASDNVRIRAYYFLQPTDWVVTREMETGVAAPADITAYRTAVRSAAADKVATIEGKQKLSTLADYLRSEEFTSWPEPPTA